MKPARQTGFFKGEDEMIAHEMVETSRVYDILREHLGDDTMVSPESDLLNDLGIDSLEQVELGLKLEKDLHVKIAVTDLRSCITVEEVIEFVQRCLSEDAN
jgi:acyl carrier protein